MNRREFLKITAGASAVELIFFPMRRASFETK